MSESFLLVHTVEHDTDTYPIEVGEWRNVLTTAKRYGWAPRLQFPDAYTLADGRAVPDEEATAIGHALERALDDMPDHMIDTRSATTLFEKLGGAAKQDTRALAPFLTQSGFTVQRDAA